jgi:hypothetical protein
MWCLLALQHIYCRYIISASGVYNIAKNVTALKTNRNETLKVIFQTLIAVLLRKNFSLLSFNPMVHYNVQKSPLLAHILRQINTFPQYTSTYA